MSGKADEFKKQVGADNYAKGLSVVLEKAEVDNRTLLEQLEKAEAELAEYKEYSQEGSAALISCLILKRELADLKEIIESCPTCSGKMKEN